MSLSQSLRSGGLSGDLQAVAALTLAVEGLQWKNLVWQPIRLIETVWEALCRHVLAEMHGLWGVGGGLQLLTTLNRQ